MKRKGNTGVWTFFSEDKTNNVIFAKSEWGTLYSFRIDYWETLSIINE